MQRGRDCCLSSLFCCPEDSRPSRRTRKLATRAMRRFRVLREKLEVYLDKEAMKYCSRVFQSDFRIPLSTSWEGVFWKKNDKEVAAERVAGPFKTALFPSLWFFQ